METTRAQDRIDRLGRQVHRALGHYVYLYIDPRTDRPFYVGKGVGDRVLAHRDVTGSSDKGRTLDELRDAGLEPRLVVVRHGMTKSEALAVEAVLVQHVGLENLTNEVAGHGTGTHGRMSLEQLRSRYDAPRLDSFEEPTVLFRITRTFEYRMAGEEATEHDRRALYEATRGTWPLGSARKAIRYAMAVYDGVVQEIFEIDGWQPGGTDKYVTRPGLTGPDPTKWEFIGRRCEDETVRTRYIGGDVRHRFPRGYTRGFRYCWPDAGALQAAA